MRCFGGEGHDPRKNPLSFGADPDQGADPGFFFFFTFFKLRCRVFSNISV